MIEIGKITSPFGIKGGVKIYPLTNDWDLLFSIPTLFYEEKGLKKEIHLQNLKKGAKTLTAYIEGVTTIEEAELFRGTTLYCEEEDLPELPGDEYYLYEIIGMKVITDEGARLGTLTNSMDTGAGNVYVITSDEGKEILLPAIDEVVLKRDFETNEMTVHILPGLLD